jgi:hypothetical protein
VPDERGFVFATAFQAIGPRLGASDRGGGIWRGPTASACPRSATAAALIGHTGDSETGPSGDAYRS